MAEIVGSKILFAILFFTMKKQSLELIVRRFVGRNQFFRVNGFPESPVGTHFAHLI